MLLPFCKKAGQKLFIVGIGSYFSNAKAILFHHIKKGVEMLLFSFPPTQKFLKVWKLFPKKFPRHQKVSKIPKRVILTFLAYIINI